MSWSENLMFIMGIKISEVFLKIVLCSQHELIIFPRPQDHSAQQTNTSGSNVTTSSAPNSNSTSGSAPSNPFGLGKCL